MDIRDSIIIYTVFQELKYAAINNPSVEVREYSKNLLDKIEYELDRWEGKN